MREDVLFKIDSWSILDQNQAFFSELEYSAFCDVHNGLLIFLGCLGAEGDMLQPGFKFTDTAIRENVQLPIGNFRF